MARPLRIERAGGWYHITARGNERHSIYRDETDRVHFCALLAEMVAEFRVVLHVYALMDNHYHLLLELVEANLSRAVQWLNLSYSVWFNRRHGRSGHLFQGRFNSVIVDWESLGLELSRYIHLNPVRTGRWGLGKNERQRMRVGAGPTPQAQVVRERIAALRRYRWSSYRAYVGLAKAPAWLECGTVLKMGGGRKGRGRQEYREFVEGALREGLGKSPWEELKEQAILGSQEFVEMLRGQVAGDEREQRAARRLRQARPTIDAVIRCVEELKGQKWEQFRDRHGDAGRDLALYFGRRLCGMKLRELAELAGVNEYATVAMALKRLESRLTKDRDLMEQSRRVQQMLNIKM